MENEPQNVAGQNLALITGAAQRIGRALAEHLAEKGWSLAIHCNRSEKEAAILSDSLFQKYPCQSFAVFKADLSDNHEVESLLPRVIEKMGIPEMLINNASLFVPGTIAQISSSFLENMLRVNLNTPLLLSRDFANHCRKGMIINLADTRISGNQPGYAAYTLSKKMLWEVTKMAAVEFAPGIRVNAIAPGLILPPEEKDGEYLLKLAAKIPMKRPGGIQPLLEALDYILKNDYLTGQLLFCDGGENLI